MNYCYDFHDILSKVKAPKLSFNALTFNFELNIYLWLAFNHATMRSDACPSPYGLVAVAILL
jgi:hypothetical protein